MPHTALYRKRRPRAFSEIVGQPHIVRTLGNQLRAGQINHAYLFCGTRGTGKTSAAKILARAVNCLEPKDGEPCNVCEMCESILTERSLDVAEIDAASNNGVESIRYLSDEAKNMRHQGRYKVYIVDEVHMLSTSAFNALLKTLEEPPPHVVFILATTDPQKIPATILSRCQRYDFRRISAADIVETLKGYLREEGLGFEDEALEYIAYHSDGAMRDALSLLDQCISMGSGEGVTPDKVREMLGAVDRVKLFEFTDALAACDGGAVMAIISEAMDEGRDVSQFASDLVRHFRDVLVTGLAGGADFSSEMAARLAEQSKAVSSGRLMGYINAFSETLREMRFAPHMRTAFEVCALRICMPSTEVAINVVNTPDTAPAKPPQRPVQSEAPPVVTKKTNTSLDLNDIAANWDKLCRRLPMPLRSQCSQCGVEADGGLLKIIGSNGATITLIKGKQSVIREAIADYFNLSTPPNLAFEVREAYNKGATAAATAAGNTDDMHSRPQERPETGSKILPNDKPMARLDEVPFEIPMEEIPMEIPEEAESEGPPHDWASFGEAVDSNEEW